MNELYVPIRILSVSNQREHWRKKHDRNKAQGTILRLLWKTSELRNTKAPVNIKLSRIAPRSLDNDNNIASMKHIQDTIADLIIPGLKPGRADDDPRLTFLYDQKKGKPKEYALLIEIMEPTNTK